VPRSHDSRSRACRRRCSPPASPVPHLPETRDICARAWYDRSLWLGRQAASRWLLTQAQLRHGSEDRGPAAHVECPSLNFWHQFDLLKCQVHWGDAAECLNVYFTVCSSTSFTSPRWPLSSSTREGQHSLFLIDTVISDSDSRLTVSTAGAGAINVVIERVLIEGNRGHDLFVDGQNGTGACRAPTTAFVPRPRTPSADRVARAGPGWPVPPVICGSSLPSSLANSGRSVFAPLAFSR